MNSEAQEMTGNTGTGFDVECVRADFPALNQQVRGTNLTYLDSAATALKPTAVIEAVQHVYERDCANIHRAVHVLSQRATEKFEAARDKVRRFIGAPTREEVIFTSGTTGAINLVAHSWARSTLGEGDEILISGLEHHSNIVPWQLVCQQTGARLVVAELDQRGQITVEAVTAALTERTRLVAIAHVSNALGTILPVKQICSIARERGALVLLDGAQAVPHVPVDVADIGCDFYCFSGHKLYGPTGVGVLWGRAALLDAMPPYQGGGDMIRSVTFDKTDFAGLPHKFEAGTPNIAGVIGLGAAIDYLESLDLAAVHAHEAELLEYGTAALEAIPGVRLIGTAPHKLAVLSFTMDCAHPHDIGTIVDASGVAIRTGHHCAQPVMAHFGIPATARASLGIYNNRADLDALVAALEKVRELFA